MTPDHRRAAERRDLRYPSDLNDDEWAIVAPMIPPARQRKRSVNVREVLNGIFYVLWTGCQWKALPKDLLPKSTVHDYLELWNGTALWSASIARFTLQGASRKDVKPARRQRSSTRRPQGCSKRGLCSILQATTRARRSKVASGTSWSTHWASC